MVVEFLIFCMATVGLTAILVDGKVFAPFRERLEQYVRAQQDRAPAQQDHVGVQEDHQQAGTTPSGTSIAHSGTSTTHSGTSRRSWSGFLLDMLSCYQCCGFWSGLFCGLFLTVSEFYINSFAAAQFGQWHQFGKCGTVLFLHFYAVLFWLMCGLVGSFLATVYLMIVELVFAKTMLCRRTNPEVPEDHALHQEAEHGSHSHHVSQHEPEHEG